MKKMHLCPNWNNHVLSLLGFVPQIKTRLHSIEDICFTKMVPNNFGCANEPRPWGFFNIKVVNTTNPQPTKKNPQFLNLFAKENKI